MSNDTDKGKRIKRDQLSPREVREEVAEEIRSSGATPLVRQPNRDRARGDWDRTGDPQDVGTSRSAANDDTPDTFIAGEEAHDENDRLE
jgi:hypothetical protein